MLIGDKIRELRAKKDISQQDLAKAIGVSDQAVSAWENNKKQPRMGAVEKLATYFNVPKSYLIEDDIGIDKLLLGSAAIAGGAGLLLGSPILSSIMTALVAVGDMANTIDSHADDKLKEEANIPFLMTKGDDEKEVLQIYRSLPAEHKATIRAVLKTLSGQQNTTTAESDGDSGTQKGTPSLK